MQKWKMAANGFKVIPLCLILSGCGPAADATGELILQGVANTFVSPAADAAVEAVVTALPQVGLDKSEILSQTDEWICERASHKGFWGKLPQDEPFVEEAHRRSITCDVEKTNRASYVLSKSDDWICKQATYHPWWQTGARSKAFFDEAFRRGLKCGIE